MRGFVPDGITMPEPRTGRTTCTWPANDGPPIDAAGLNNISSAVTFPSALLNDTAPVALPVNPEPVPTFAVPPVTVTVNIPRLPLPDTLVALTLSCIDAKLSGPVRT
jgi:hypothetical protein